MPISLDWYGIPTLAQPGVEDHWQQLGVGGTIAVALIWIVLQFVLRFVSIRRETKPPSPPPTNGTRSGERSVEYWEKTIGELISRCVEKEVTSRLIENTADLRAIREILNEMRARRRP